MATYVLCPGSGKYLKNPRFPPTEVNKNRKVENQ